VFGCNLLQYTLAFTSACGKATCKELKLLFFSLTNPCWLSVYVKGTKQILVAMLVQLKRALNIYLWLWRFKSTIYRFKYVYIFTVLYAVLYA